MHFTVALVGHIRVTDHDGNVIDDSDVLIEQHLDEVMEELLHLDAQDPSIILDMSSDNEVTFSVLVEASNPLQAVERASGQLRSAIHAAHGSTPDWPGRSDKAWAVTLVSVRSELVTDEELAEVLSAERVTA
ncbi:MAG: hypothetical protein ACYDHU_08185 [Acidimicrobiales bacterium]